MSNNNEIRHGSYVTLKIKLDDYKLLAKTIQKHKDILHLLSMNPLMKKALIKGIHIIRTILEKSEKGVK